MDRMHNVALFEDSARSFLDLVSRITPEQWEKPGLGTWTVRSLAGHTMRAITTVNDYLATEAPSTVSCPDAETYLLGTAAGAGSPASQTHDAIAQRGVAAGELLAATEPTQLTQQLERVLAMIAAQPSSRVVSVLGGRSILLSEYLRARNFELVVHAMDVARATGMEHTIPSRSVEDAAALAARVAVRQGRGQELLLAVTGRFPLNESFSVM
ncbi:MAG: maleylpyruvate isomerase family mycothiol-dependent enzyme [Terrimesophilobacter sp.]